MYVYVYVCMHICMLYACVMYVCIYVNMYVCVCVCVCVYVYVHIYVLLLGTDVTTLVYRNASHQTSPIHQLRSTRPPVIKYVSLKQHCRVCCGRENIH